MNKLLFIAGVLAFIIPLITVHTLFKINPEIKWFSAEWEAGDIINYIVTFLSAAGTIFLSYIAIKQNDRLMKLESDTYNRECGSDIIISHIDSRSLITLSNEEKTAYEVDSSLCLEFANYGNAILKKVRFDFGNGNIFSSHLSLAPANLNSVNIPIPKLNETTSVKVTFTSCYNVKTHGEFTLKPENNIIQYKYYHYLGITK